jgi:bifunctional DNase/RNase
MKKAEAVRMMVDMKVSGLTVDPFTNMPILVLRDQDGKQAVPIWIGLIEASAIATELERIQLKRPMTHDLLHNILGHVGAKIDRVEVHDLRDNTFYAQIILCCAGGKKLNVDSRPSDAVALALRAQAPILVARKVIERARKMDLRTPSPPNGKPRQATKAKKNGKRSLSAAPQNGKPAKGPKLQETSAKLDEPAAVEGFEELLETLRDEDFGKWKM